MVDRNYEWWMKLTSWTPSDGLDQGDLTQWMADINDMGMSDGIDRLLTGLIGDFAPQEHESGFVPTGYGSS
jgi:hypothetical protein